MATIRRWIEALGDEVRSIDVDGTQAWMLGSDARAVRRDRSIAVSAAAAGV
jgi:hypothetical protein